MNSTPAATAMNSTPAVPLPDDPIALDAELKQLHARQLERKRLGLQLPPDCTSTTADRLLREWNDLAAQETRRMIDILTKLRKTATGPAARGSKRGKKLPIDIEAFAMSMGLEKQ